jgi:hypothetical protein
MTERIALSQGERGRLRVLHEVKQKQITQMEAAKRLKISDRHIRRLLVGLGKRGDRAVIHGLRGRRSNRRLAERLELKILRRVRQRYADFGPTLAAEHLAQEGLPVSRETLRKWMVKASLWCPRAQRVKTIHVARWPPITRSAGMATAGACHAKKCARVFAERRWKSNDDWMARTGYASAAAISACVIARHPTTVRKSLRPTASRTRGTNSEPQKRNQTKISRACRSPLEKTVKVGTSILRKTGHFYFALTARYPHPSSVQ